MADKTIYVASKAKHGAMWRRLRDAGYKIISTWIDESEPGQTSDTENLWLRCVAESSVARYLILYHEEGEQPKGSLVELGVALANGRRCFIVGLTPDKYSVVWHPLVTICPTIGVALNHIKEDN